MSFPSSLGNCAHFHKGGWWYNACGQTNLNGVWYSGGVYRSKFQDGIFWADYGGGFYSLKSVCLMIRPIEWNLTRRRRLRRYLLFTLTKTLWKHNTETLPMCILKEEDLIAGSRRLSTRLGEKTTKKRPTPVLFTSLSLNVSLNSPKPRCIHIYTVCLLTDSVMYIFLFTQ